MFQNFFNELWLIVYFLAVVAFEMFWRMIAFIVVLLLISNTLLFLFSSREKENEWRRKRGIRPLAEAPPKKPKE